MYKHRNIPVSAPQHLWSAAGYTTYTNTDTVGSSHYQGMDSILAVGAAMHPQDGQAALVWAIKERQRQQELQARNYAQLKEAESLAALALAIRESASEQVLQSILGRLTDRTRYAVRAQLGAA